jgi:hypothetical protein
MKQGSTDDPFAEEPASRPDADDSDDDAQAEEGVEVSTATTETRDWDDSTTRSTRSDIDSSDDTESASDSSHSRTLPYIYKRDAVKQHRSQRPVYLRKYNEKRIPDLKAAVEDDLGEDVTKTDVLEAAMETALDNPKLVARTLRTERYGYDWE